MASESEEPPRPVRRAVRTVTPPYRGRSNEEMNLIGYLLIGGLLILLVPLGPIILVAWVLVRIWRAVSQRRE